MEVEPLLESARHRDSMRRELGYEPEDVVIGKIARLFHLKGHGDVIRAAEQLVRRHPRVRFLLVGDGVLRGRLERQIAAAGLTGHFQLHRAGAAGADPAAAGRHGHRGSCQPSRRARPGAAAGPDRRQAGRQLRRGRGAAGRPGR